MTPEVKERIEQIRRGEVPEGYKKDKKKLYPISWDVFRLSEFCQISQGYTFKREYQGISEAEWNYFKVADIGLNPESAYLETAMNKISNEILSLIGAKPFPAGSIVFPRVGAALLNNNKKVLRHDSVVDDNVLVLTITNAALCDNLFLYFMICEKELAIWCNSGLVPVINSRTVLKDTVCLPHNIYEQKRIAELLTTQDKVIELKEKLIAEKQRQKKHLMQQLLTGKKRLPGFSGEWHTRKFSDIFSFLPTNTLSRADMCDDTGLVMNVHYGDVLIKYAEVLRVNQNKIPYIVEGKEPAKCVYLQNGDIVIADTAEDMTVGKATEVQGITCEKIVSGLHTMCVRPKNGVFAPEWLGFYINSTEFHGQLMRLACGSKVSSISKNTIKDTILNVPTITEQTAIANILSTADREVELLQQELEQEKQKKKSLMQLLLTGIVRA